MIGGLIVNWLLCSFAKVSGTTAVSYVTVIIVMTLIITEKCGYLSVIYFKKNLGEEKKLPLVNSTV
jgi:hypothetical protein